MPRWELFTAMADTEENGLRPLWYWRRIDDARVHMPERGFPTLQACVDDARRHGLTDEPINLMTMQTSNRQQRS
ncbi:MAG: hypothetical protein ACM3SS_05350 [Rhodospirillaceae bacterium]